MRQPISGHFLLGLLGGVFLGSVALLIAAGLHPSGDPGAMVRQALEPLAPLWQVVQLNLRGSVTPFAVVLLAYALELSKLNGLLAMADPPVERVLRHEQLVDLCSNLFFGIGVIWTAIGMRDALLFALGQPDAAAAQGAFTVLQRMVDGGILLALSTTIVGGIGGYLMRAGKSLWLGQALAALYMRSANESASENLAALQRIERHLARGQSRTEPETEPS